MEVSDILLIVLVFFSIWGFSRRIPDDGKQIVITNLKVVEGESFGSGRNGFAELQIVNFDEFNHTCQIIVKILQDGAEIFSNQSNVLLVPGEQTKSVVIILPNGENEVVSRVDC